MEFLLRKIESTKDQNMANRQLLGKFLVASPLIMLIGVAIEARTSQPSFEPYEYSNEQDNAIRSLRPYVCVANEALRSDDPDAIYTAATNWVYAIRVGWLAPLKRANYFDSSRSGIKGQISATVDQLAFKLTTTAESYAIAGQTSKAIDGICLALALTGNQKYSDIDSIGYFAMRERVALQMFHRHLDTLDAKESERLLAALSVIDIDETKVLRCSATADRLYAIDGLRWNEARSRILDHFARSQAISNSARRSVNKFSIVSLSRPLFDQANSIRYATTSLETEKRALNELQAQLKQRLNKLNKTRESK